MPQEPLFKGKIHKFVLIPVCTVYNSDGEVVREHRMKPIEHFTTNVLDLKETAKHLEERANSEFFGKIKTT